MNFSQIELRHLRCFIAVAEAGTFRSAALNLHISQPPLTRQIHQLEEFIDAQLFERKPRGVELTKAGVVFLEDAKNLLMLIQQSAERTKLTADGQLGCLDIGIFGSAIFGAIPIIIQAFKKSYPKVEVSLHNLDRPAQLKALRDRRLSIAFNRFFIEEDDMTLEKVHSDHLSVALHQDHPLAHRKKISIKDLSMEPLILYPRTVRPSFIDHIFKLFENNDITLNINQEVDDAMTALALVSAGFGISFLTRSACNIHLPNVVYITLEHEISAAVDLQLIYRKDDTSPLLQSFLTIVHQVKEQLQVIDSPLK